MSFPRAVAAGIAVISGVALVVAFVAQYGFDLWPCQMCYWQRVPFVATLVFGTLAALPGVDPKARRHTVFLCVALLAFNAGLAAYHTGVEYKWWEGPASCGTAVRSFDIEDLTAALSKPAQPGCDEAAIRVLGVSMAGANALFCAAAALLFGAAAGRRPLWQSS